MGLWTTLLTVLTIQNLVSGVLGGAVGTLAMFGLNWFKDRSLTKHKEGLARESARLTHEMTQASNQTLELLRTELSQSTEAFKSSLRKKEWLFDKELLAVNAFLDWRGRYIPTPVGPSFDIEAAADALVEGRFFIEKPMRDFITAYAAVLPTEIRTVIRAAYAHYVDSLARASLHEGEVGKDLSEKAIMRLITDVEEIEKTLFALIRD